MAMQDFSAAPLEQLVSLKGRTAVVTGGARGIGFAIANRLAEAGANLVIVDIDAGDCMKKAIAGLQKHKAAQAVGFLLDTRNPDDMERAAQEAEERFGGIDIWINDAGVYPSAAFVDLEEEMLNEVIDINIKGVIHGARSAALRMQKEGGVILNLASVAGFQGLEKMTHYNASKFAVRGITAGLAKELGAKNIRVVAIAPTLVDTPGIHEQMEDVEEKISEMEKTLPLGRVAVADDIARVALALVSDLAAFVTGTTVVVDGGDLALG